MKIMYISLAKMEMKLAEIASGHSMKNFLYVGNDTTFFANC